MVNFDRLPLHSSKAHFGSTLLKTGFFAKLRRASERIRAAALYFASLILRAVSRSIEFPRFEDLIYGRFWGKDRVIGKAKFESICD